MGENINLAKGVLMRTLELLREVPKERVPDDLSEINLRIQIANNALVQNERKIWLRTKAGKEMVGDFSVASTKLLGTVERLQRLNDHDMVLRAHEDLKAALGEVELHAKRLNEETRKRSMVVT